MGHQTSLSLKVHCSVSLPYFLLVFSVENKERYHHNGTNHTELSETLSKQIE